MPQNYDNKPIQIIVGYLWLLFHLSPQIIAFKIILIFLIKIRLLRSVEQSHNSMF